MTSSNKVSCYSPSLLDCWHHVGLESSRALRFSNSPFKSVSIALKTPPTIIETLTSTDRDNELVSKYYIQWKHEFRKKAVIRPKVDFALSRDAVRCLLKIQLHGYNSCAVRYIKTVEKNAILLLNLLMAASRESVSHISLPQVRGSKRKFFVILTSSKGARMERLVIHAINDVNYPLECQCGASWCTLPHKKVHFSHNLRMFVMQLSF